MKMIIYIDILTHAQELFFATQTSRLLGPFSFMRSFPTFFNISNSIYLFRSIHQHIKEETVSS